MATTAGADVGHPLDYVYPSVELPYPAIRVIIGQHFHFCVSPRFWAWYIVGAFYDSQGHELWHTEIFLLYRDRRGYSLGLGEFDTGLSPPRFALLGECESQRVKESNDGQVIALPVIHCRNSDDIHSPFLLCYDYRMPQSRSNSRVHPDLNSHRKHPRSKRRP